MRHDEHRQSDAVLHPDVVRGRRHGAPVGERSAPSSPRRLLRGAFAVAQDRFRSSPRTACPRHRDGVGRSAAGSLGRPRPEPTAASPVPASSAGTGPNLFGRAPASDIFGFDFVLDRGWTATTSASTTGTTTPTARRRTTSGSAWTVVRGSRPTPGSAGSGPGPPSTSSATTHKPPAEYDLSGRRSIASSSRAGATTS